MSDFLAVYEEHLTEWLPQLLESIGKMLRMTALAFTLAFAVGLPLALAKTSTIAPLRRLATAYIETRRGLPGDEPAHRLRDAAAGGSLDGGAKSTLIVRIQRNTCDTHTGGRLFGINASITASPEVTATYPEVNPDHAGARAGSSARAPNPAL